MAKNFRSAAELISERRYKYCSLCWSMADKTPKPEATQRLLTQPPTASSRMPNSGLLEGFCHA